MFSKKIMSLIYKVARNIKLRIRANFWKIEFSTLKNFILPYSVQLANNKLSLSYPKEEGIKSAFIEIFLTDSYHLNKIKLPIKNPKIIDIGANIGFFSIAARRFFPSAEINSYEPNPALFSYLNKHSSQANFKVYPEAVGKSEGFVSLSNSEDSIMGRITETNQGTIKMIAFKEVLNRIGDSIDLLKLDCEGAEWEILQDIDSMKKVHYLTMEYHLWAAPGKTTSDLKTILKNCGFEILSIEADVNFGTLLAVNSSFKK